jgi:hypothetical protein
LLAKAWKGNYLRLISGFYQLVLVNVRIYHKQVAKVR